MTPRFRPSFGKTPRVEALVAITATSVRYRLMIEGMNYISPHDTSPHQAQTREQTGEIRDALIASFPPDWRRAIFVAGVLGDAFNIELKPPISEEAALAIGRAFEKAFPGFEITLNTWFTLAEAPGAVCTPWTPHTWPRHLRPPSCRDR